MKTTRILVRYHKVSGENVPATEGPGGHPGDVCGIEVTDGKQIDPHTKKILQSAGDRLMKQDGTVTQLSALEAIAHLSKWGMLGNHIPAGKPGHVVGHGYSVEQYDEALKTLTEQAKKDPAAALILERHEAYNAGEAERVSTEVGGKPFEIRKLQDMALANGFKLEAISEKARAPEARR